MAKVYRPGRVVVILAGRFAGKKGVVVSGHENGSRERPYGHALVMGLSQHPGKVTPKMSENKVKKQSKVQCFVKYMNLFHLMPTRYVINDVDVKALVDSSVLDQGKKKKEVIAKCTSALQEKFLDPDQTTISKDMLYLRQRLRF